MNTSALKIPVEAGIPRWSRAALALLEETATDYNAVLTSTEFAEEVQRRAGAWANVSSKSWIRKVLAVVTLKCTKEDWPHLASLVVRPSDGRPGPWYFDVLSETGPGQSRDEVEHAAGQRLACYLHFGAELPADPEPTLDPLRLRRRVQHLDAPAATPARAPKKRPRPHTKVSPAAEERRGQICPTCFMEMPLSGVCTNCA